MVSPNRKTQKTAQAARPERISTMDVCQTPPYALDPLIRPLRALRIVIDGMIPKVWDPAAGQGLLARAWRDREFLTVETDLLGGVNFLDPFSLVDHYDAIVTNPPYSLKYDFLEQCLTLGRPFALLVPVETLGAARAQKTIESAGCQVIFMDHRVNFKMPNKGWAGAAWFPVCWICGWLNLPDQMNFAHIDPWTAEQVIAWESKK